MRLVIALGGNALLKRGQPLSAEIQRNNIRIAAKALADIAGDHELIITHGNGPQVGLLATQAAAYKDVQPYPLDMLGAETEGMIGYVIEQELGNLVPFERPFATILTMVEVDPNDPAFKNPVKPIGPVYSEQKAKQIARKEGWIMKPDGEGWRRVIPSPEPKRIFELRPIKWLLERNTIVICTGGGGIPVVYDEDRKLHGAEVIIDKDRTSALLAEELEADLLIFATDADGVYRNWGAADAEKLDHINPNALTDFPLPEGSMGPKFEAACAFALNTNKRAVIGSLEGLKEMVNGTAGTIIET